MNDNNLTSRWFTIDNLILALMTVGCALVSTYATTHYLQEKSMPLPLAVSCGVVVFLLCASLCVALYLVAEIPYQWAVKLLRRWRINLAEPPKNELPLTMPNNGKSTDEEINRMKKENLKRLFGLFVAKVVAPHLHAEADAHTLYNNMVQVMEADEVGDTLPAVAVKDLSREDIYHIGFFVKYYLRKRNEFGAEFIYRVFGKEFQKTGTRESVERYVLQQKLSANEASSHLIDFPPSALRPEDKSRMKQLCVESDVEQDIAYYEALP